MKRALPVLILSLWACSSGTVADVGPSSDAAARPDARADAAPADQGFEDAEPIDTGPGDSGVEDLGPADLGPADQGFMDANEVDAGPADTGLCTPVARGNACGEIANVVAAHALRCNPELLPSEAQAIGERFCTGIQPVIDDQAVSYDQAAAGQCLCDLQTFACDAIEPLGVVPSCAGVITGTITQGNLCFDDHRCAPGLYCHRQGVATFGSINGKGFDCDGTCEQIVQPGAECYDTPTNTIFRCVPGHYCETAMQTPLCMPEGGLGARCENIPCRGQNQNEAFLFSPFQCVTTGTVSTCQPYFRAMGDCFNGGECHELYECQPDYTCALRPGAGQSCIMTHDVAMPSYDETSRNLSDSIRLCRVPPFLGEPGFNCVQTGTTSGQGTCTAIPRLGQACGIGQNLSALCELGSYCAGIDPNTLAPVSSMCAPEVPEGGVCNTSWTNHALGLQCEPGTFCLGKGIGQCVRFSFCVQPGFN